MAFNKAASYRQMVGFLEQAGYDVPVKDIDDSKSDFAFMSRLELLRYASVLEATYEARTDNMDGNAILDEISEVNARLAGQEHLGQQMQLFPTEDEPTQDTPKSKPKSSPQQEQPQKKKKPSNLLENISNDLNSNPGSMAQGVQNALRAAASVNVAMNPSSKAPDTMPAMPKMPAGKVAPNTLPFGMDKLMGMGESMLPGGAGSMLDAAGKGLKNWMAPKPTPSMPSMVDKLKGMMGKKVQLSTLPDCDFCGKEAQYDGTTVHGPSAYMCKSCLGTNGKGEPTELTTDKIDMPECSEPEIHQLIDEEGGDCPGCGMSSDGGGWF